MHLQKPLSLLDELEMELSMRAVSKHRNIPFEVTRYEREGDDTVVYGYNLLTGLSQEIKGTLSLTASDKHGDLHSATLFERHQDGPKQVKPGGVLVFEQCYEKSDGNLVGRWASSLFKSKDVGTVHIDFATVRCYETSERKAKPTREVFWLDTQSATLVHDLASLESCVENFLQATHCESTTPAFVVRAFDECGNAIAAECRQKTAQAGDARYESIPATIANFWHSQQGKMFQRVFNAPAGMYKVEVIRAGVGYFTKQSNDKFFDAQGKVRLLTGSGKEHHAAIIKKSYGHIANGLFTQSIVGTRRSNITQNNFYHYTKPVSLWDPFYRLEHVPTANFIPLPLKECYPLNSDDRTQKK
ncbi:hypothetical protein [Aeromonas caviae]|uniref:hypothetical protein n=1 Tax=Aeromonas caviae TaxID=648 RepID=UPI000FEB7A96|nr:hypothetical protein [Aeromonas caviae]RWT81194.1 hypothetical protein DN604_00010 [Aeromonas caviae]